MNSVRIIGGDWRRRVLRFPDSEGLRPTPDRVRETLFNWLGQDLSGLCCLDLFAGSGILGFEAASRGATEVVMVEKDRRVFAHLERAAAAFADPRLRPVCGDALKWAAASTQGFDLVFLDPPYRHGWLERVEPLLPRVCKPGARIYAEAEHSLDTLGAWQVIRRGAAGQVHFHLLENS